MDASLRRDPALMAAANPGLPILQPDDTQQPSTQSSGTAEFPRWNDGEPMSRADVCKIQEYEEDLCRQEAEDAERCRDMHPEELSDDGHRGGRDRTGRRTAATRTRTGGNGMRTSDEHY